MVKFNPGLKLILLILLFTGQLSIEAQNKTYLGIKGGGGFSRYYFAIYQNYINQDFAPIYQGGLVLNLLNNKNLGVQIEALYTQKAWIENVSELNKIGVVIDNIQWSPDGKRIAFWVDTRTDVNKTQTSPYRLFVVDIQSQQVTDYCISGNYQMNKSPVWSPDGRQIVVTSNIDGIARIFLVDLEESYVIELVEGELVGWMVNP